ncbi:hypothetical protein KR044_007155 [Drosophila immigrans]|nr:hypothetical protein KR044_007155 [Drosophila immigrans]
MSSFSLPLLLNAGIYLLLTVLLISLVWSPLLLWWRKRRRVEELAAFYPGPKRWPLLGNANLFIGLEPAEVCLLIADLAAKYGDTFYLRLGSTFSLMMFNPQDVEAIMNSLLDKAVEYNFLRRWLHEGLLVSRGRKWQQRRRIITPAFHFRILEQYVEIFERQTRQMLKSLQAARGCDGRQQIDLGHASHLCTLDIICGE